MELNNPADPSAAGAMSVLNETKQHNPQELQPRLRHPFHRHSSSNLSDTSINAITLQSANSQDFEALERSGTGHTAATRTSSTREAHATGELLEVLELGEEDLLGHDTRAERPDPSRTGPDTSQEPSKHARKLKRAATSHFGADGHLLDVNDASDEDDEFDANSGANVVSGETERHQIDDRVRRGTNLTLAQLVQGGDVESHNETQQPGSEGADNNDDDSGDDVVTPRADLSVEDIDDDDNDQATPRSSFNSNDLHSPTRTGFTNALKRAANLVTADDSNTKLRTTGTIRMKFDQAMQEQAESDAIAQQYRLREHVITSVEDRESKRGNGVADAVKRSKKTKKNKRCKTPKNRTAACFLSFAPLTVFLLVGATVYTFMEGLSEADRVGEWDSVYNNTLAQLAHLLLIGNISQQDHEVMLAALNATLDGAEYPPLDDLDWDLATGKSFFFVVTIVTTIGYGFSAPVTMLGKLMTMLLATVGIVTFGYTVTLVTERLLSTTRTALEKISTPRSCGPACFERWKPTPKVMLTAVALLNVAVIMVTGLIGIFGYPDWGWANAVYWAVITFTTVGLGDFFPYFLAERTAAYKWLGFGAYFLILTLGIALLSALLAALISVCSSQLGGIVGHHKYGAGGMQSMDRHNDVIVSNASPTTVSRVRSSTRKMLALGRLQKSSRTQLQTKFHRKRNRVVPQSLPTTSPLPSSK